MRTWVQSLASLGGLKIWHCSELRCRWQKQFRSCVAVAQAGSYIFDSTPSLGTSICLRCGPIKTKDKKKKNYVDFLMKFTYLCPLCIYIFSILKVQSSWHFFIINYVYIYCMKIFLIVSLDNFPLDSTLSDINTSFTLYFSSCFSDPFLLIH